MEYVDSGNFKKEVLESKIPVMVDFYADWCPPCRMYAPAFEAAAARFAGKVKFVKLNVDRSPDIARLYSVMSIPTTIMFKDGKQVGGFTGAYAEEDLTRWIEQRL